MFWGLDASLAYKRHFPSINWLNSYSLYGERLNQYFAENVARGWPENVSKFMFLLSKESELEEIVKLVGMDALSPADRLTMEVARSIREDYLIQNAFDEIDTYTSLEKMYGIQNLILDFYSKATKAIEAGVDIEKIAELPVREKIGRAKSMETEDFAKDFALIEHEMDDQIDTLINNL